MGPNSLVPLNSLLSLYARVVSMTGIGLGDWNRQGQRLGCVRDGET